MRNEIIALIDQTGTDKLTYLFRSIDTTHPKISEYLKGKYSKHQKISAMFYCEYYDVTGLCQCGSAKNLLSFNKGFRKFCPDYCSFAQEHKKAYTTAVANSEEVKVKKQETCMQRYGEVHHTKAADFINARKEYFQKNYGVDCNLQSDQTKMKIKKTMFLRYNCSNISQRHYPDSTLKILSDRDLFNDFISNKTTYEAGKILGTDKNTLYTYIKKYNSEYLSFPDNYGSSFEKDVGEFILGQGYDIQKHNRTILAGKEIDLYIPELKLAIECNGDYWHSEKFSKFKDYHYQKWQLCQQSNIKLLSFFESEWMTNRQKIENVIMSHMSRKQKGVGARQCTIHKISSTDSRAFLDEYHLQNFTTGTHYFGAYHNGQLIAIMVFGWTRGTKISRRFELKRWVTDNYTHPGLFSKTFKFAQKELGFTEVVSFSDNRWFDGNLYQKCGFNKIKITPPNYWYYVKGKLRHCSNYTKANISKKFPHMEESFKNGATEEEAMAQLGYYRIWDCGKTEWSWSYDHS